MGKFSSKTYDHKFEFTLLNEAEF